MNNQEKFQYDKDHACKIELCNVSLDIDGKAVLKDLNVDIETQRLGVLGRNGSGKSTLSRLLSGLVEVGSGELRIAGFNPYKDRAQAVQTIGLLFQNPDHQIIFPTVIEELSFGLRQLGQDKSQAEQNALDTLASFGKSHWKDIHTSALSQGQKHLVCLMAVVAMKPKLIILDEPFAGLDIPTKKQLQRYLDSFGGALIHITHDPDDLNNYDQLLWLEAGQVQALGEPSEVLPKYLEAMHKIGESDDISNLSN
ncbi:energy-coupling factor ABC transporter ATP-binding protein [Vibrio sp. SCSIO 43136]|uniref:energy-coupling factor ABC transporter ATP-binding protein n=1 Tax=Vibrio sp. SCSIO 43136 TaxID=2819101 RepID=UPI002074BE39|nr:energy-coupling factor ABC transporter ATP-binding protein [Vibrio sp. SCSIO 43136]USD68179.1 energy-coupling factor ABC transporter ATP-binding protein [Vibrio sp. SCSIO 43136]